MTLPDLDSFDTFGGAMTDYASVEDPTTDESAVFRNKYVANVAMMSVTAPRAICSFVGDATTPGDPAGFVHAALWGSGPGVKPAVTHEDTGEYLLTYPATVNDPLAVEHTLNFRRAFAQVQSGFVSTLRHAVAEATSANTVTVYTYLADGTADDLVDSTITVWIF